MSSTNKTKARPIKINIRYPLHYQIAPGLKVGHPGQKSDKFYYDGDINAFETWFGQKKNFDKIQDSLAPFGLQLDHIWAGVFTRSQGAPPLQFIAADTTRQIHWRKYEADGTGSGQNYFYIHNYQMKTTEWLKMTQEQRQAMLSSKIPDFNLPSASFKLPSESVSYLPMEKLDLTGLTLLD